MAAGSGAWVPYLNNPIVCSAFVVMVASGVVYAALKATKLNKKIPLIAVGGFFFIALVVVFVSAGVIWRDSQRAASNYPAQPGNGTTIARGASSSVGNVQINAASFTVTSGSSAPIVTGINMSGSLSNNVQVVSGSNNTVTNQEGRQK